MSSNLICEPMCLVLTSLFLTTMSLILVALLTSRPPGIVVPGKAVALAASRDRPGFLYRLLKTALLLIVVAWLSITCLFVLLLLLSL